MRPSGCWSCCRSRHGKLRLWFDAQTGLRTILEEYVDFDRVPALVARDGGRHELFVGAVEVLTGDFIAFRGTDPAFGVDAVVASGTLPELSRAAVIDSGPYAGVYWDGLYSQNPPISVFFHLGEGRKEDKPDEIINPRARSAEPQTLRDIVDRRNELAGNQSLEQELDRTRSINRLARAFEETRAALAEDGDGAARALRCVSARRGAAAVQAGRPSRAAGDGDVDFGTIGLRIEIQPRSGLPADVDRARASAGARLPRPLAAERSLRAEANARLEAGPQVA